MIYTNKLTRLISSLRCKGTQLSPTFPWDIFLNADVCRFLLFRNGTSTVASFTLIPRLLCPAIGGHFGIARSVRLYVPWRSSLGYRHADCLQLSRRRPPEMCGLWTRPWTDVDPPRFLDPWTDADGLIGGETICHRRTAISGGGISSRRPRPGRYRVYNTLGVEAKHLAVRHLQTVEIRCRKRCF